MGWLLPFYFHFLRISLFCKSAVKASKPSSVRFEIYFKYNSNVLFEPVHRHTFEPTALSSLFNHSFWLISRICSNNAAISLPLSVSEYSTVRLRNYRKVHERTKEYNRKKREFKGFAGIEWAPALFPHPFDSFSQKWIYKRIGLDWLAFQKCGKTS